MMAATKKDLLQFFDRPTEPFFIDKNGLIERKNSFSQLPDDCFMYSLYFMMVLFKLISFIVILLTYYPDYILILSILVLHSVDILHLVGMLRVHMKYRGKKWFRQTFDDVVASNVGNLEQGYKQSDVKRETSSVEPLLLEDVKLVKKQLQLTPNKPKGIIRELLTRYAQEGREFPAAPVTLPNLSLPLQLPYYAQFSLFAPAHLEYSGKLIDIFMKTRDLDELLSVAAYCQQRVNPYMFIYCLSVAIVHRPEYKSPISSLVESFPDKFLDRAVFRRAGELLYTGDGGKKVVELPPTASKDEPEQRVAYFREDIGVNLHHWYWHLIYPTSAGEFESIVIKDRRGELFYYMHQQIMARYTVERFCNKLGRVERFSDFHSIIKEGYFPKLNLKVASRNLPPRFANVKILDLDRPKEGIKMKVSQMDVWRDLIVEAIEAGAIELPNGDKLTLDEESGIDVLGNLMEATSLSKNKTKYGNLHNMAHNFLGLVHDPDYHYLEEYAVMGDPATSMRDPVFYRLHAYLDDIFNMHKLKLGSYRPAQLQFSDVVVSSVRVVGPGGADTFATQWEQSEVQLQYGMDFHPRQDIAARFTYLQHEDFHYCIHVRNNRENPVKGTVRIFLGPVADERGQPLDFEEQRRFMVELDKFSTVLNPGENEIKRSSKSSSVTIPYERSFQSQKGTPGPSSAPDLCGCGWPEHMLLPRGSVEGYPVVVFVMVTNWDEDRVPQCKLGSNKGTSYCGLRDRLYPDKRAMGFPFDRPNTASDMREFLQPYSNMATRECTIRFTDTTRLRGQ